MRSVIAIVLLVAACNGAAQTCSTPSLSEQLQSHSYVLLVEIVGARIEQSDGFPVSIPGGAPVEDITVSATRMPPLYRRVRANVRVLESYKGADPPIEFVFGELANHPEVTVGGMYLVFANGPDVSMDCGGVLRVSSSDPQTVQLLKDLRSRRK